MNDRAARFARQLGNEGLRRLKRKDSKKIWRVAGTAGLLVGENKSYRQASYDHPACCTVFVPEQVLMSLQLLQRPIRTLSLSRKYGPLVSHEAP
jgi:hypothetical protein